MSKKTRLSSSNSENRIKNKQAHDNEEPVVNTAGAARRRLLRTLGGSGGVAVGALLASGWHKPMIKAAVVPAHAQSSGPSSCPITFVVSSGASSDAGYSISAIAATGGDSDGVLLDSTTDETDGVLLSGNTTLPPGVFNLIVRYSQGESSQIITAAYGATCCNNETNSNANFTGFTGNFGVISGDVSEDGECQLFVG